MKRKGITLPRGWQIRGTRREAEARAQGQVYSYFRIDWTFQAPDGRSFQSLKAALAAARHQARQKEEGEVGKEFLAMAREEERRFQTNVYSIAGIRPVRKFADGREDNKLPALQEATREGSPPSQRMSAFKTNPVTLAQFSRMRGRGFLLSQVGEIEGPSIAGWFSSKLEHLCRLASDPPSPAPPSPRPGLLTIQIYWETEDTRGLNLEEYREKLRQAAYGGDVEEEGGEKKDELYCSEDELELESTKKAVQRRLKRMLMLPAGWRQRLLVLDGEQRREWIDPHGQTFRSLALVLSHLELAAPTPEEGEASDASMSGEDLVLNDSMEPLVEETTKSKKIALKKRKRSEGEEMVTPVKRRGNITKDGELVKFGTENEASADVANEKEESKTTPRKGKMQITIKASPTKLKMVTPQKSKALRKHPTGSPARKKKKRYVRRADTAACL